MSLNIAKIFISTMAVVLFRFAIGLTHATGFEVKGETGL